MIAICGSGSFDFSELEGRAKTWVTGRDDTTEGE